MHRSQKPTPLLPTQGPAQPCAWEQNCPEALDRAGAAQEVLGCMQAAPSNSTASSSMQTLHQTNLTRENELEERVVVLILLQGT